MLVTFYLKHCPAQLGAIDTILQWFVTNHHKDLNTELRKVYGEGPLDICVNPLDEADAQEKAEKKKAKKMAEKKAAEKKAAEKKMKAEKRATAIQHIFKCLKADLSLRDLVAADEVTDDDLKAVGFLQCDINAAKVAEGKW
jgi:hypothetical protein